MRWVRNVMLTGLAAVLPLAVTLYLLVWLMATAEALLGALIRVVLPHGWYWPGMGVAAALGLIFVVGLMANAWMFGTLLRQAERAFERIPLVKTIFGGVRDLFGFITGSPQNGLSRTVHVALTPDIGLIGFVTREDLNGLAPDDQREDRLAVYLPMSYQIGGYTLLIPRERLTPLDIPAPEAMRLILTAGVTSQAPGTPAAAAHPGAGPSPSPEPSPEPSSGPSPAPQSPRGSAPPSPPPSA